MLETDSTPDNLINFVLQNGWRLKAQVDEETGGLNIYVSNEKGTVYSTSSMIWRGKEEIEEFFCLVPNEKENN